MELGEGKDTAGNTFSTQSFPSNTSTPLVVNEGTPDVDFIVIVENFCNACNTVFLT